MMPYKVVEHPLVEQDLMHISELIAEYAGLRIANAKIDEITSFITALADFPSIGSVREELMPELRALRAGNKAVVCFLVDEQKKTLRILHISYAGADWQKTVKSRL